MHLPCDLKATKRMNIDSRSRSPGVKISYLLQEKPYHWWYFMPLKFQIRPVILWLSFPIEIIMMPFTHGWISHLSHFSFLTTCSILTYSDSHCLPFWFPAIANVELWRSTKGKRQMQSFLCCKPAYLVSGKDLPMSFSSTQEKEGIFLDCHNTVFTFFYQV